MRDKRGQVTIFIIIAILIVLIGLFIFLIYPRLTASGGFDTENPKAFIQSCVEDDLEEIVEIISIQGGIYEEPLLYDYYQLEKVQYLCHTPNYDELCTAKTAFLREYVEEIISEAIKDKVNSCFETLKNNYIEKGFGVILKSEFGIVKTNLLPQRIFLEFQGYEITLSKGDNSETYKNFNTRETTNLRKLVDISSEIINDEASMIGGIDINPYRMENLEVDIKVTQRTEGTTVYHLIYEETGDFFQFATRSNVYQPGS